MAQQLDAALLPLYAQLSHIAGSQAYIRAAWEERKTKLRDLKGAVPTAGKRETPPCRQVPLPQGRLTATAELLSTKALYCARHCAQASLTPLLTSCE